MTEIQIPTGTPTYTITPEQARALHAYAAGNNLFSAALIPDYRLAADRVHLAFRMNVADLDFMLSAAAFHLGSIGASHVQSATTVIPERHTAELIVVFPFLAVSD